MYSIAANNAHGTGVCITAKNRQTKQKRQWQLFSQKQA
jgi:hypothetical protein